MKKIQNWSKLTYIAVTLLVILTAVFYVLAVDNINKLSDFQGKISYVNESRSISPTGKAAYEYQFSNDLADKGGQPFVFWGQKDVCEIRSESLDTKVNAPVILTSGNTDLIFSDGKTLDYNSREICLLGGHTAGVLFGDKDVEGLVVKYAGKDYIVHGILEEVDDAFVISTSSEEDTGLNRFDVKVDSNNEITYTKDKVEQLYAPGIQIDYGFMIWILQIFLLIIPVVIFISFMRNTVSEIKINIEEHNKLRIFFWSVFITLSVAVIVLLIIWFTDYPLEMIPPKLSDFDYWSRLWEEKKNSLSIYFRQEKTPSDMLFIVPYFKSLCFNILSVITMVTAVIIYKRNERKNG